MSFLESLDRIQHLLVRVLRIVLVVSLIAVLIIGTLMIRNMSASERSQGGVLYVGGAMVVVVALIIGKIVTLLRTGRLY
jgi:hypothetical protein